MPQGGACSTAPPTAQRRAGGPCSTEPRPSAAPAPCVVAEAGRALSTPIPKGGGFSGLRWGRGAEYSGPSCVRGGGGADTDTP